MLDLFHFGDEIGEIDDFLRCVTAGDDNFNMFRAVAYGFDKFFCGEKFVEQGDVGFVHDDDIVFAAFEDLSHFGKTVTRDFDVVFRRSLDDEAVGAVLSYFNVFDEFWNFEFAANWSGFGRRWDWQTLQSECGGNLFNTGPHPVDQAVVLFGEGAQSNSHIYTRPLEKP